MTMENFLVSERVAEGKQEAARSRAVFCGLARNNAGTIKDTISRIATTGAFFKEWEAIIFENNSDDETLDVLAEVSKDHPVTTISHTYRDFKPFGPVATRKRAEHMAKCRNVYLDKVKHSYDEWQYMIVSDMDLQGWSATGVLHSLSYMNKYDVLSANGIDYYNSKKIYYDIWTLVIDGVVQNNKIRAPWNEESSPIAVDSGFGGLAIYKIQPIQELSYGAWHDNFGVYGSEHTGLHMALKGIGAMQAINPFMLVER